MSGSNALLDSLAHPAQINLLADYGGAANTANAIWQNRLVQSQQAAGQAYQQATDPTTGVVDPARAQALIAANPTAALSAQSSAASGQALQGVQLEQSIKRMGIMTGLAAPLLATGQPITKQQWIDTMASNTGSHGFTKADITANAAGIPDATPQNPYAVNDWLRGHVVTFINPEQRAAAYGQPVPTSSGGATVFPRVQTVPPNAGATPSPAGAPPVTMTPTTAEMNTTQQTWNPATRQFEATRRLQVAPMVDGAGNPIPGSAVPGLPATGRPAASGATAAPPPGTNITQPSPGTPEEMVGSAQHALAARDRANNYQATIYPIEGAITALSGADTGKGGEILNNIRGYLGDTPLKYLSNFLPSTLSDQEKRTIYDEANKYTTAMQLAAPGGTRSNEGQAAAAASNPNVHISNAAALAVSKSILAQKRMEQAGTLAFNQTGQPGANYDTFMNTWNTNQDPRGFMADRLKPAERADVVKSLGGVGTAAYQRYKASYLAAQSAKVTDSATQ